MAGKKRKRSDRDRIVDHRRTSPCRTSCQNLGRMSRGTIVVCTLPDRKPRKFQQQIMALLSWAVVPEERGECERRFREVATIGDEERPDVACICRTPLIWISWAYQCEYPIQLQHMGKLFKESGTVSEFLDRFYLMDIILNRCPIGMGMRSGTTTVHLLPPWRRGRRRIVSGWSDRTNLRMTLTRKITNSGPWSCSSLSVAFFTVRGNGVKTVLACQNHLSHLI